MHNEDAIIRNGILKIMEFTHVVTERAIERHHLPALLPVADRAGDITDTAKDQITLMQIPGADRHSCATTKCERLMNVAEELRGMC